MKTLFKMCSALCVAMLFLFVALQFTPAVHADNTTLTTQVPEQHIVKLTIRGAGTVTVNGTEHSTSSDIPLPRHSEANIIVTAANGYILKTVYYNGEDVTGQFVSSKWTMPQLQGDATLSVSFLKKGAAPETGDNSNIRLLFAAASLSLTAILLLTYSGAKKRTKHQ